ncbi:MAG: ester cyclase [Spirochaetaceae bacterium]|nr:MAG: ester cyclase [Spirochaetaceae bacterium]
MSVEQNKELVRRSVDEFYNTGDVSAIERIFSSTYCEHQTGGTLTLEQFKKWAKGLFSGIPDLKVIIHDLHAEGDMVTKRWTVKGTHKGEFMGVPASGNAIEVQGISIYRVQDGKLAEGWEVMDSFTLMVQMGAVPAPA